MLPRMMWLEAPCLSSISASLYARIVRRAMRIISPIKKNQLKKLDHAKIKWKTMIAVKSKADCQA